MPAPRIFAVDIGASHVVGATFTLGATGRLVLQRFATESRRADSAGDARNFSDVPALTRALATRLQVRGPCTLIVPGHLVLTKFIKTAAVSPERRRSIMAFEAAENIPHPLGEVVWDYAVVAEDAIEADAMLCAVKADAIQALCTGLANAGCPSERALPSGAALERAFRCNYPEVRESAMIVHVRERSTHLLFVEGDRFYLRTIPLGTCAKVQDAHSEKPNLSTQLAQEVLRSVVTYRRHTGAGPTKFAYVAGDLSQAGELPQLLQEKLHVRVERYDALRHVDLSADAHAADAETSVALPELVGAATRLLHANHPEPSLLPPEMIESMATRRRQPRLLAAAALGVVALFPPLITFHQQTTRATTQAAELARTLQPLHALQRRNDENLQSLDQAKTEVATLQRAYAAKTSWVEFFGDLQARLANVEDVWLDQLRIVSAGPDTSRRGEELAADSTPPVRIAISGRLLDVEHPQSKVSAEAVARAKRLLANVGESPFVAAVENERFDSTQDGLLRFDFTITLQPEKPW